MDEFIGSARAQAIESAGQIGLCRGQTACAEATQRAPNGHRLCALFHQLNRAELADLLHMTPYYWSASEDKQAAIAELDRHQVDCEFELFSFVSPKSNSD